MSYHQHLIMPLFQEVKTIDLSLPWLWYGPISFYSPLQRGKQEAQFFTKLVYGHLYLAMHYQHRVGKLIFQALWCMIVLPTTQPPTVVQNSHRQHINNSTCYIPIKLYEHFINYTSVKLTKSREKTFMDTNLNLIYFSNVRKYSFDFFPHQPYKNAKTILNWQVIELLHRY